MYRPPAVPSFSVHRRMLFTACFLLQLVQLLRVWLNALDCDLTCNVFGQHLAREQLVKAVKAFVETDHPSKLQVLSFHGWSETGKTPVQGWKPESIPSLLSCTFPMSRMWISKRRTALDIGKPDRLQLLHVFV